MWCRRWIQILPTPTTTPPTTPYHLHLYYPLPPPTPTTNNGLERSQFIDNVKHGLESDWSCQWLVMCKCGVGQEMDPNTSDLQVVSNIPKPNLCFWIFGFYYQFVNKELKVDVENTTPTTTHPTHTYHYPLTTPEQFLQGQWSQVLWTFFLIIILITMLNLITCPAYIYESRYQIVLFSLSWNTA